jgi:hypothetical protein
MTKFSLHQNEIAVPPEREAYNAIRRKYQKLAEQAANRFASKYADNFKTDR